MKYQIIPVTPFQQNCSLVWCESTGHAALVDPGGEVERLLEAASRADVTLTKVLLTHGHLDHVGGTARLKQELSIPIEGPHKDDWFWIDALDQQSKMMGLEPVASFEPDRWLDEGDLVSVGEETLSVHHCPGHTPGHVVFHHRASSTAFVGDVLFKGSIGRTDFPKGDHKQLIHAIRHKLWPLGDQVTFIPGHGPNSTFGVERSNNPFVADKRFG